MSAASRSERELREWRCDDPFCLFRTKDTKEANRHADRTGHAIIRGARA